MNPLSSSLLSPVRLPSQAPSLRSSLSTDGLSPNNAQAPNPGLAGMATLCQGLQAQLLHPQQMAALANNVIEQVKAYCSYLMTSQQEASIRTKELRFLLSHVNYLSRLHIVSSSGVSLATTVKRRANTSSGSRSFAQAVLISALTPDAHADRGIVRLLQELRSSCYRKLTPRLQDWFSKGKLYQGGPWRSCLSPVILAQVQTLCSSSGSPPIIPFLDLDTCLGRLQLPLKRVPWHAMIAVIGNSPHAASACAALSRSFRGRLDQLRATSESRSIQDKPRQRAYELGLAYTRHYHDFLFVSRGYRLVKAEEQYAALVDVRDEIISWQEKGRRRDSAVYSRYTMQAELFALTMHLIDTAPPFELQHLQTWLIEDAKWGEFAHIGHRVGTVRALQGRLNGSEPFDSLVKLLFSIRQTETASYIEFLASKGVFDSCDHLLKHLRMLDVIAESPIAIQRIQDIILRGLKENQPSARTLLIQHSFLATFHGSDRDSVLDTLVPDLPKSQIRQFWDQRRQHSLPTNLVPWGRALQQHKCAATPDLIEGLRDTEPVLAWELYQSTHQVPIQNPRALCRAAFLRDPSFARLEHLASFPGVAQDSSLILAVLKDAKCDALSKLALLEKLKLPNIPPPFLVELAIQTGSTSPLFSPFKVSEQSLLAEADALLRALLPRGSSQLPALINAYPALIPTLIAHLPVDPHHIAATILSSLPPPHQSRAISAFFKTTDATERRIDAVIQVARTCSTVLPAKHPEAMVAGLVRAGLLASWNAFNQNRHLLSVSLDGPELRHALQPALLQALAASDREAICYALSHPNPALVTAVIEALSHNPSITSDRWSHLSLSKSNRQRLAHLVNQRPSNQALRALAAAQGILSNPWRQFLKERTLHTLIRASKAKDTVLPQNQRAAVATATVTCLQSTSHSNALLLKLASSPLGPHLKDVPGWVCLYQKAVATRLHKGHKRAARRLLDSAKLAVIKHHLANERLALHILDEDWVSFERLFASIETDYKRWLLPVLPLQNLRLCLTRFKKLATLDSQSDTRQKRLCSDLLVGFRIATRGKSSQKYQNERQLTVLALMELVLQDGALLEDRPIKRARRYLIEHASSLGWKEPARLYRYLFAKTGLLSYERDWAKFCDQHKQIITASQILSVRLAASLLGSFYECVRFYAQAGNANIIALSNSLASYEQRENQLRERMIKELEPLEWQKQLISIAQARGYVWSRERRADQAQYFRTASMLNFLAQPAILTRLAEEDKAELTGWCRLILDGIAINAPQIQELGVDAISKALCGLTENEGLHEAFRSFIDDLAKLPDIDPLIIAVKILERLPEKFQWLFGSCLTKICNRILNSGWDYPRYAWSSGIGPLFMTYVQWCREQEIIDILAKWALSSSDQHRLDLLLQTQAHLMGSEANSHLLNACNRVLPRDVSAETRGRILALGDSRDSAVDQAPDLAQLRSRLCATQPSPRGLYEAEVDAVRMLQAQEMRMRVALASTPTNKHQRNALLKQAQQLLKAQTGLDTASIVRQSQRLRVMCGLFHLARNPEAVSHFDAACIEYAAVCKLPFAFELQEALLDRALKLPDTQLQARHSRVGYLIRSAREHALYPNGTQSLVKQVHSLIPKMLKKSPQTAASLIQECRKNLGQSPRPGSISLTSAAYRQWHKHLESELYAKEINYAAAVSSLIDNK